MIKFKSKMIALPKIHYFNFFSSIFTILFLTIIFLIPDKNIINIFGTDDAYYYFQIAKNISLGHGPTFDQISTTNGFQPLWLICLIPIFLFENIDLFIPLRLILLFSFIIFLSWLFLLRSVLLSLNFLEENIKKTIIILILFPSIIVVKPNLTFLHFIGGTEFILNIFLLTCVSLITLKFKKDEILSYVFLGLFSGLCLLARLDNILLIYFFPLYLILFKKNFVISFKNIFSYASPACLLVIPYLSFNFFYFNEFVPISGQTKMYWNDIGGGIHGGLIERIKHQIFEYIPIYKYYKSNNIMVSDVFFDFFKYVLPWYWHFLIFYLILIRSKSLKKNNLEITFFVPFIFIHFLFYILKFGFIETKYWYWSFEYLFLILLFLAFLESNIFKEKIFKNSLTMTILIGIFIFSFEIKSIKNSSEADYYLSRINFLENNTDNNAIIATPNAGGLGYFSSRKIVNSDGLVNSYDYLNSIKDGKGYYYLKSLGVNYIFSTKISLKFEPYKSMFEAKLSEIARWTNNEGGQLHILYKLE